LCSNPEAGQRSLGIARWNPNASQASRLLQQMQFVLHGSSSSSPIALGFRTHRGAIQFSGAMESVFGRGELALSIPSHALNSQVLYREERVRESPEARLEAVTKAHIAAQDRTPSTRRFLCGFDAHGLCCFSCEGRTPRISFVPYPHRVLSSNKRMGAKIKTRWTRE
jgi:hypothetical protein